jgi:hypothetical protein
VVLLTEIAIVALFATAFNSLPRGVTARGRLAAVGLDFARAWRYFCTCLGPFDASCPPWGEEVRGSGRSPVQRLVE